VLSDPEGGSSLVGQLTFSLQESETGLYICLNTFLGFGRQHVEKHYAKTENAVYLHVKRTKKPVRTPVPVERFSQDFLTFRRLAICK
jgi:Variant UBP zinc finger